MMPDFPLPNSLPPLATNTTSGKLTCKFAEVIDNEAACRVKLDGYSVFPVGFDLERLKENNIEVDTWFLWEYVKINGEFTKEIFTPIEDPIERIGRENAVEVERLDKEWEEYQKRSHDWDEEED